MLYARACRGITSTQKMLGTVDLMAQDCNILVQYFWCNTSDRCLTTEAPLTHVLQGVVVQLLPQSPQSNRQPRAARLQQLVAVQDLYVAGSAQHEADGTLSCKGQHVSARALILTKELSQSFKVADQNPLHGCTLPLVRSKHRCLPVQICNLLTSMLLVSHYCLANGRLLMLAVLIHSTCCASCEGCLTLISASVLGSRQSECDWPGCKH